MEQQVSEGQPVQNIQQSNQAQVQNLKGGNKLLLIIIIILLLAIIIGGSIFAFTQLNNQNIYRKEKDKPQEQPQDDSKTEKGSNNFSKEEAQKFIKDLYTEFSVMQNSMPKENDLVLTINQEATVEEIYEQFENIEEVVDETITAIEKSRPKILALSQNNDTKEVVNEILGVYDFLIDYFKELGLIVNAYQEGEIDLEELSKKMKDFLDKNAIKMNNVSKSFQVVLEQFAKKFGIDIEEELHIDETNKVDYIDRMMTNDSLNNPDNSTQDDDFSEEDWDQFLKELEQYQN